MIGKKYSIEKTFNMNGKYSSRKILNMIGKILDTIGKIIYD